ncbi:MAG: hypothetical protein COU11_01545 [Candidatus Harrisonbacteria bacterium CG10_big_fil_rev_8_21_14_0_10_49_15]|uniref:Glycosyltransferase 2-like domain-containing protein n=1 Tax=Candidatus Harrisonbacteria bacterium CG10_big_fil_rev_8_21_14_0_10_49_15 TaxID=1974587 RepID=A0A2H0ULD6_9BACT|nr:MAG: hypothetical protein COU11_01545 [Candidatus Harrisonbacteria bacterium CG10_big_fil_rev_8_21_14_0_10_49_15]
MANVFLSVVIPAHNEARRLPLTLIDIDRHLAAKDYSYEIIVALSPSQDNTAEILDRFKGLLKPLRVVNLKENKGRGYAVIEGMKTAKGQWRLAMDADNSVSITELEKMLPYLGDKTQKKAKYHEVYDIAIASRFTSGAHNDPAEPASRKWQHALTRLLVTKGVKDPNCGFKVFSAQATEAIFPNLKTTGWLTEAEALRMAQKLGYSIYETPVFYSYDNSNPRQTKDHWQILKDILKISMKRGTDLPTSSTGKKA